MTSGVLERSRAVVIVLGGAAVDLVLHALDVSDLAATPLGHECAAVLMAFDQMVGNMAELGREVLVNEEDVHRFDILDGAEV